MMIFHSCVSLPEGIIIYPDLWLKCWVHCDAGNRAPRTRWYEERSSIAQVTYQQLDPHSLVLFTMLYLSVGLYPFPDELPFVAWIVWVVWSHVMVKLWTNSYSLKTCFWFMLSNVSWFKNHQNHHSLQVKKSHFHGDVGQPVRLMVESVEALVGGLFAMDMDGCMMLTHVTRYHGDGKLLFNGWFNGWFKGDSMVI